MANNLAGINDGNNHVFPDVKMTKSDELLVIWSSGKTSAMNLFIGKLVIH
jgi:hypothetical protein